MSIGIDGANPFVSGMISTPTSVTPPAGIDSLGQSLSVRNFEEILRLANGPGVSGAGPGMPADLRLAQADPAQPVPGTTATDVTPPLVSAPGTPPVGDVGATAELDARLRAAEGLGLASDESVGPGNSILNGLEQLRSVFDSQYGSVNGKLQGTTLDANAMMALQADLVEYAVLVDVSSKLAGKVTTAIDSLMKGQ